MKIAIFNNKGGVGKTTLAVHIAFLAMLEYYTLTFLDADRQANSMAWLSGHQWDGDDYFEAGSVHVTCNLDIAEEADPLIIDAPPDFYFIENLTLEPDLWVVPIGGRFSVEGAIRVVEALGDRHDARVVLVANMTNPNSQIGRHEIDEAFKLGLEVFPLAIPRTPVVRKAEMLGLPAWDVPYGVQSPAVKIIRCLSQWLIDGADEDYVYSEHGDPRTDILKRYEI